MGGEYMRLQDLNTSVYSEWLHISTSLYNLWKQTRAPPRGNNTNPAIPSPARVTTHHSPHQELPPAPSISKLAQRGNSRSRKSWWGRKVESAHLSSFASPCVIAEYRRKGPILTPNPKVNLPGEKGARNGDGGTEIKSHLW
ncbi:hypothetical protein JMJ77_0011250 [Colletotrichum scovillei]|uniref:Uncharacterized protein n=1 Tax=Colletotrichum scovillei TaxID=1209932 RepID=A0A9P7R1M3_9PEZI|nr:hypothetical protein JMJ77_0011250 [Colletotrichum scovillei]KAG7060254.1 hypothetical protein JMJ78_0015529 [Colletotrichum scovillei]KAG7067679.1 hypothetical protein JMJ76_0009107 [Colletotrichum scovillei]